MTTNLYDRLTAAGITRDRLTRAKAGDNWGHMVNALEYLTVLDAVLADWPDPASKLPVVGIRVDDEERASTGEEGVVHLVCPYDGCRAVDRIAVVEDAGEVELGLHNGAYLVDGALVVDFATSDEYVETEWQDKHVCRACQKPVTMPDYAVSYDGAGV